MAIVDGVTKLLIKSIPHNEFWIESKSPDFGIGVIKQTVKRVNSKEIDFNYCNDMNNITFSD